MRNSSFSQYCLRNQWFSPIVPSDESAKIHKLIGRFPMMCFFNVFFTHLRCSSSWSQHPQLELKKSEAQVGTHDFIWVSSGPWTGRVTFFLRNQRFLVEVNSFFKKSLIFWLRNLCFSEEINDFLKKSMLFLRNQRFA